MMIELGGRPPKCGSMSKKNEMTRRPLWKESQQHAPPLPRGAGDASNELTKSWRRTELRLKAGETVTRERVP